jgi:hypothetical protein
MIKKFMDLFGKECKIDFYIEAILEVETTLCEFMKRNVMDDSPYDLTILLNDFKKDWPDQVCILEKKMMKLLEDLITLIRDRKVKMYRYINKNLN